MPRTILYLITEIDKGGGAEKHLLSLVQNLDRTRFQPEVAYLTGRGELADAFRAAQCPVVNLDSRVRVDPVALVRLTRQMARQRYDIVHTHLFRADCYGALATWLVPGSKLVTSKHYADPRYRIPVVRAVSALVSGRADRVIAISDDLLEFFKSQRLAGSALLRRIYYGVDDTRTGDEEAPGPGPREELGLPAGAPLILTAGRLTPDKGHRYLLDAMPRVLSEIPSAHLLIAGRGELEATLRQKIRSLGLEGSVHLLGLRPDVPALLKACDLFVLPSLREGLGLVLLEAMVTAIPIVATRVGAIPEIVENDVSGLLVPPQDPPALAEAIVGLLNNRERATAVGNAGRARLGRFSIPRMVEETQDLYEEILGTPRSAQAAASTRP